MDTHSDRYILNCDIMKSHLIISIIYLLDHDDNMKVLRGKVTSVFIIYGILLTGFIKLEIYKHLLVYNSLIYII